MRDKSTERGFTLIEVIVVAVLISVLALGAFSLFGMYTNSARETAARLRLQRQAEALTGEFSRYVRDGAVVVQAMENASGYLLDANGGLVLSSQDPVEAPDFKNYAAVKPPDPVIIRDGSNNILAAFNFDANGVVRMAKGAAPPSPMLPPTPWPAFEVGGEQIFVDAGNSKFELEPKRKLVRINMTLRAVDAKGTPVLKSSGQPLTQNIQIGAFKCRN
ncbi:MAG: type II secretion system GspH family protein [Chitinispirillia bacterium]|nr:type II secretion system GspH family protein [Chitinispirillia bacterium]